MQNECENQEEMAQRAYRDFDTWSLATLRYREKCARNEEYWRGNHWPGYAQREQGAPEPVTPVLFSTLESVLADMMDHYPEPTLLGEEPGDDALAEELTQLTRFILKRRGFRNTYRQKCRAALKKGASALQVYWDEDLLKGAGDVNVRAVDIECLLWDPSFADVQDGRALIHYGYYPKSWFAARYPQKMQEILQDGRRKRQEQDEMVGGEEEEHLLVDYWYKEPDAQGALCVHLLRLAGGVVLEDSKAQRPQGMYAHGQYPFIVEALYPIQGLPVGLGMIDILCNMQQYADQMDQMILKNLEMSARPKMMINRSADIDQDALTDWSRDVVTAARIDEGAVRWLQAAPLSPYVLSHHRGKLEAIKEQSGQNQFNRGEVGGGVTAASAIVALQEAGNKRSRMLIEQMNDGFEKLVGMIVELVAENYTQPRRVRVRGEEGERLITYDNRALRAKGPLEFDVSIRVQKQTPYGTLYQNELAMQLLATGIAGPHEALDMMRFEGKERLLAQMQSKGGDAL